MSQEPDLERDVDPADAGNPAGAPARRPDPAEARARAIFAVDLPDGLGRRRYDPHAVWRRIYAALGDSSLQDIWHQGRSGAPAVRLPAEDRLAEVAAAAFDLPRFDERDRPDGLLVGDLLEVFFAFFAWEDAAKKATPGSPSSSPPSGGPREAGRDTGTAGEGSTPSPPTASG